MKQHATVVRVPPSGCRMRGKQVARERPFKTPVSSSVNGGDVVLCQPYFADMAEVIASIGTLYQDQLKPFGRILRKRLAERALAAGRGVVDIDMLWLRSACAACSWLSVQQEEGDWFVLLHGWPTNFVDIHNPEDIYPVGLWEAADAYFRSLDDAHMMLPGGRYSCAQSLRSRELAFLAGWSLGQICHIVQLAISRKKLLGYLNGSLVPHARSNAIIKERCAKHQRPCAAAPGSTGKALADWQDVRNCLQRILGHVPGGTLPLANIKRLFRSRFCLELSETALGHTKLSEMLQAPCLRDVCTVRLQGNGYVIVRVSLENEFGLAQSPCPNASGPVEAGVPTGASPLKIEGDDEVIAEGQESAVQQQQAGVDANGSSGLDRVVRIETTVRNTFIHVEDPPPTPVRRARTMPNQFCLAADLDLDSSDAGSAPASPTPSTPGKALAPATLDPFQATATKHGQSCLPTLLECTNGTTTTLPSSSGKPPRPTQDAPAPSR